MHMLLNHDVKHICDEVLKRTPSDCSLVNHGTQEEQDHTTWSKESLTRSAIGILAAILSASTHAATPKPLWRQVLGAEDMARKIDQQMTFDGLSAAQVATIKSRMKLDQNLRRTNPKP